MSKEIPILFSTPMVQAILEGRKTQTRRIVKLNKEIENPEFGYTAFTPAGKISVRGIHKDGQYGESFFRAPYGKRGDRLWVRETFCPYNDGSNKYWHKATDSGPARDSGFFTRWRPSIHMPKAAARIWLEVESVGVERLQEITNTDAKAEGIEFTAPHRHGSEGLEFERVPGQIEKDAYAHRHITQESDCYLCPFKQLWQSINGPESWGQNPWVWVIKFKRA